MSRKNISFTLSQESAAELSYFAENEGQSVGQLCAEIVLDWLHRKTKGKVTEAKDLQLLRGLRDEAIEKMHAIIDRDGFSPDITLRTFQACKSDPRWMEKYIAYVRGDPFAPGNSRKTNANQTIGSRIKSELGAADILDNLGKPVRGKASGEIIQTYQMLQLSSG